MENKAFPSSPQRLEAGQQSCVMSHGPSSTLLRPGLCPTLAAWLLCDHLLSQSVNRDSSRQRRESGFSLPRTMGCFKAPSSPAPTVCKAVDFRLSNLSVSKLQWAPGPGVEEGFHQFFPSFQVPNPHTVSSAVPKHLQHLCDREPALLTYFTAADWQRK